MPALPRIPVSIGPGGFFPFLLVGALFGFVGSRLGMAVAPAAAVGAVGGTGSLIAHELGHLAAARKVRGVRPLGVSLVWLGAVTTFEGRYRSGRDQTRVALAGPATSLLVAAALGVPALWVPMHVAVRELILALIVFNVAVALFNLLPIHPLDGHKAIVGAVWSLLGTEDAARRVIRSFGAAWLWLEALGTVVLVAARPADGAFVVLLLAGFAAQSRFARRRA